MPPDRIRADQLLVDRGLAESRSKAQALIMAGLVIAGDKRVEKAGQTLAPDQELSLKETSSYVSRGATKLLHGLDHFKIDPKELVCIDIGASTGGFSDVLIKRGAKRVYAVDVGYGQLHWSLRTDPKIVNLERINARHLTSAQIPEPADLVVCDASFIALEKVLPAALDLAPKGAQLIALIKPQFQAGRGDVGKGGVVRDPETHERVCRDVHQWLESIGWQVLGLTQSPIKGPKGNIEFLIAARKR